MPRKSSDGSNSSASEASEQEEELAFPMDDDPKVEKREKAKGEKRALSLYKGGYQNLLISNSG